ncbi:MAG: DoxX family protein [Acidimicrobiales bacterium]
MPDRRVRTAGRLLLGGALTFAGISHLTTAREEFQAQVPDWFPADPDLVVVASGLVEIGLGAGLLVWRRRRIEVGWTAAAFFVAIFPGNIAQYVDGTDGFGLDSDRARFVRLLFQPALVAWALWSTGAWRELMAQRSRPDP